MINFVIDDKAKIFLNFSNEKINEVTRFIVNNLFKKTKAYEYILKH